MLSYFRFRYRRAARRYRRDVRLWQQWMTNYINRHIWGKWYQLKLVRRFMLSWLGLMLLAFVGLTNQMAGLSRAAQVSVAVPGGVYSEAAVGSVQNLNPLLPESATADDINRLVYSGLTRYNEDRQIVPDLAESWTVSSDGRTYTFKLRHGVKWHDGVPFTAADVAFTLTAIQNPDSRSPLASSWQGVKAEIKADDLIVFTLPAPLTSFLDSTTMGIVPRHLLETIEPSQLREAAFNQDPVGTGPFKIKTFAPNAHEVELEANPGYYLGKPKLTGFRFKFYDTATAALAGFRQHQVTSPGQIKPEQAAERAKVVGLQDYQFTLPEETVLFFQNTNGPLSDKTLRGILSRSLNRSDILSQATGGDGQVLNQPLLPGQLGYTTKYAATPLDVAAAGRALTEAGWVAPKASEPRQKNGQKLSFELVTLSGGELERAAQEIKHQWAPLGVQITIKTAERTELQQTYMRPRNFQMLLFGINVGADPDVYSFWHSSQAKDPGVNLSGYNSPDADRALEAGRVKTDKQVREGKYDAFLKAWDADSPAAVLYQSGYLYATSDQVEGISGHRLVVPSDRYYGVEQWTVNRRWSDR
jgi:peptide/nickel transport system substrate-binding protein